MKKTIISLLIVFVLFLNNVSAAQYSDGYLFMRDFIDCLYKLRIATNYDIKDLDYTKISGILNNQISHLLEAKGLMEKWLEAKSSSIKMTALYAHTIIYGMQSTLDKIKNILANPIPTDKLDIQKYISQHSDYWNKVYEATGYAIWVIIKPTQSKEPNDKVIFIISDKERQSLTRYINTLFKKDIDEYGKLVEQKKKGKIKEFTLTIPVWCVLHLMSFLNVQTYGQIDKIDYLNFVS